MQLATDHLPILVIPVLFGTAYAGAFALAARILQACVVLVSVSTAQAFYAHAAQEHRAGNLATAGSEVLYEVLGASAEQLEAELAAYAGKIKT